MKPLRLSASTLGIFEECPRCFYQHIVQKVKRPETPFPSLPNGIDRVLKTYVDQYRGALPPQLVGKVNGVLFPDLEKIRKYRNWQSGLQVDVDTPHGRVTLIGALDDLVMGSGVYTPLDWKTRGTAPKSSGVEYYGRQANCYALLLQGNGLEPSGEGVLVYWYPESVDLSSNIFFQTEVHTIPAQAEAAMALLHRAMACLAGGEPEASASCAFCTWAQIRVDAAVRAIAQPALMHAIAAK